MKLRPSPRVRLCTLGLLLGSSLWLSACAPLVVGGIMGGTALVATDRRTSGTQVEDQGIEIKIAARLRDQLGGTVHINVNSYNRVVLLTGESVTDSDKAAAEHIAAGVDNVQRVVNEISVGFLSSLGSRSKDLLIASKVKASLVASNDLISNAFDIVVERGDVYLMGRVSEREANRATDLARSVGGVQKVVKLFEIISEEELARIQPAPAPASAPTSAASAANL
ncbi:MAG: BON domain-containing protein [Burkholderiaceae bacterium]|nr:BON domain-containing protein [Burkholderiaceae bacterium]